LGRDGRRNLWLAAAFESGRLLALAEPNSVAALLNWRKEGFETSRRAKLITTDLQLATLDVRDVARGFAARLGHYVIAGLGSSGAARLGTIITPIDPGVPIEGIDDQDRIRMIATGFGLSASLVKSLIVADGQPGGELTVPIVEHLVDVDRLAERPDEEFAPLRLAVLDVAGGIAQDLLSGEMPGEMPGGFD
jgi:hypothetical protein